MALVFVPSLLRDLTGGQLRVTVPGATLRQVIDALDERYPGMKERLIDEELPDHLIPEIVAAIDGETNHLGLRQRVSDDTEIQFVPAIGGG